MKFFPLVAFVCIQCVLSFGQSTDKELVDINNKYQVIQDLVDANALRQYHTEYNYDLSIKKGTLTFYYNGSELKHIQYIYTKNNIVYQDKYYIWDEELVFFHKTYTSPDMDPSRKQSRILSYKDAIKKIEERFYFKDNTAIKCLFKSIKTRGNNPNNMKTHSVRNVEIECEETEELLQKYLALLEKQELNKAKGYVFPKSISKILSDEIVYDGLVDGN